MFLLGENQIQERWSSNVWMLVRRWNKPRPFTIWHIGRTSDTSKNLVIYQVSGCNIYCLSLVIRYRATVTHSYSDLLQGVAFHLCRFKHNDSSIHTKHVDKLCFKRSSFLNVALQTLLAVEIYKRKSRNERIHDDITKFHLLPSESTVLSNNVGYDVVYVAIVFENNF